MERLKRLWFRLKLTEEETVFDILDRLTTKTKDVVNLEFEAAFALAEKEEEEEIKAGIYKMAEDLPEGDELKSAIEGTKEVGG